MLQSLRLSNLFLRLSLAIVFLWFGIDKFIHPQYWVDAWVPQSVLNVLGHMNIQGRDFIFLNGILEVLVGTSLITNIFTRFFSAVSLLFLITIMIFHGFNEVIIRDVAMMGSFAAIFFWPERRF